MKISTPTSINCIQTPSTLAQAFKSQFGFGEERWIYNLVKMFPHSSAYKGRDHKGSLIYRLSHMMQQHMFTLLHPLKYTRLQSAKSFTPSMLSQKFVLFADLTCLTCEMENLRMNCLADNMSQRYQILSVSNPRRVDLFTSTVASL